MKVRIPRLASPEEFRIYAEGFSQAVHERSRGAVSSNVSHDYLQRCEVVRGIYDVREPNEMIGGYAVGARMPLRLLDFVPDAARSELTPPPGIAWEDFAELTCMWRKKSLSRTQMTVFVWPSALFDTLATQKTFVLGHNESTQLDDRYTRPGMHTLYVGESTNGLPSRLFTYSRRSSILYGILGFSIEIPWHLGLAFVRYLRKLVTFGDSRRR